MSYSVDVKIVGTQPLLQNKFPEAPEVKSKRKVGSDTIGDPRGEAETKLYRTNGVIYQPGIHIEAALTRAAADYQIVGRRKKTYKSLVASCVRVKPEAIPHEIQKWDVDSRRVVVIRAGIVRHRPRFEKWALAFAIEVADSSLSPETLQEILEEAGKNHGIGDYRQRFGRFRIEKFQVKK